MQNRYQEKHFLHFQRWSVVWRSWRRRKKVAPSKKAMKAIRRLEKIYAILSVYKMEQYITFDLSMSGIYGYYTGIIFRGYTFGIGDAIVKGGRYDHLVEKFGKEEPAIGFAIVVDELMSALSRQKIQISSGEKSSLILYDKERLKDAIQLAMEFRGKDKNTQILQKASDKSLEFYVDYGKRSLAGSMLYLRKQRRCADGEPDDRRRENYRVGVRR